MCDDYEEVQSLVNSSLPFTVPITIKASYIKFHELKNFVFRFRQEHQDRVDDLWIELNDKNDACAEFVVEITGLKKNKASMESLREAFRKSLSEIHSSQTLFSPKVEAYGNDGEEEEVKGAGHQNIKHVFYMFSYLTKKMDLD